MDLKKASTTATLLVLHIPYYIVNYILLPQESVVTTPQRNFSLQETETVTENCKTTSNQTTSLSHRMLLKFKDGEWGQDYDPCFISDPKQNFKVSHLQFN